MKFKSKVVFKQNEIEKFLEWLEEWSDYRGGMITRVDGLDIINALKYKLKYIKQKKEKVA